MSNLNDDKSLVPEIPPNDFEAEQGVISCMLFDTEGLALAHEMLNGDDFYRNSHKVIFNAIVSMYLEDQPVDLITLKNKLETLNVFEQVGGMQYLVDLFGIVSTSVRVSYYAKIVKEKSLRRKIISASKKIQKLSFNEEEKIESIISKFEDILESISSNEKVKDFVHISDVLVKIIDQIEEMSKNKSKITGLETGFVDFDLKTAGLQPSDLILIAARPSMGKTAFALNIAQYVAIHKNVTTAIFSLEMSKEQLVNRMVCSESLIDSQKLKTGDIKDDDWGKIIEAIGLISDAPIYIDDKSSISIPEMRNKCRKLKKEKNLGLIVIDYLQLMNYSGKSESRQQEISAISRSLKAMAREFNVPIVALSQLSRAVEQRRPPKPMLSDLRESGAIEQDADVVCFLYREEYYDPNTEKKGLAELIIAKQRNGAVGTIDLSWIGQYTKFASAEKQFKEF